MAITRHTGVTSTPAATVTVYLAGTLNLADLFGDTLSTLLGNPFTSDLVTGAYQFWAEDVAYDIVDSSA